MIILDPGGVGGAEGGVGGKQLSPKFLTFDTHTCLIKQNLLSAALNTEKW